MLLAVFFPLTMVFLSLAVLLVTGQNDGGATSNDEEREREVIVILRCSFVFLVFSSILSSTPTLLCLLVPLMLVLAKDGGLE
jgi:hypothetical protein